MNYTSDEISLFHCYTDHVSHLGSLALWGSFLWILLPGGQIKLPNAPGHILFVLSVILTHYSDPFFSCIKSINSECWSAIKHAPFLHVRCIIWAIFLHLLISHASSKTCLKVALEWITKSNKFPGNHENSKDVWITLAWMKCQRMLWIFTLVSPWELSSFQFVKMFLYFHINQILCVIIPYRYMTN